MRPLTKDLAVVAGLAAAVVLSLAIVRVIETDAEPAMAAPSVTSLETIPTAAPSTSISAATYLPATTPITSTASVRQPPPATLVLSSGAPVNPRIDRTPRTARPASAAPTLASALVPPPDTPDPQVFEDPAVVAAAWLSALCWYDFRAGRDDNTRRAAAYGSIDMPPNQDPWILDDRAWAQITAAQTSSACTDIIATTEILTHDGTTEAVVNLDATQVLSAAGTAYQATRISMTRLLQPNPPGHWQVGRPVLAN